MRTQGVVIVEGFVVPEWPLYGRGIPDPFWTRLKSHLVKAQLLDAFAADYREERDRVLGSMPSYPSEKYLHTALAEERLFRRWVERLGFEVTLWPWERGWTEELVDSFLVAPVQVAA